MNKGWVKRMIAMPTRVSRTAQASSPSVGFRSKLKLPASSEFAARNWRIYGLLESQSVRKRKEHAQEKVELVSGKLDSSPTKSRQFRIKPYAKAQH
jgi:hypothetical protein